MDELERVAQSDFGLVVSRRLPVTGSFSSTVLSFVATDGLRYVVKRHWARNKAEREASALRALDAHPDVPALLATSEHDDTLTLLIEGLDAEPWLDVATAPRELLQHLGRSVALLHRTATGSFDGAGSWHDLLVSNADRFLATIGMQDRRIAEQALAILARHLVEIPRADTPQLVHFDLRPGNILVRNRQLVGIIDFESSRGGHGSMDFFKLWQQVMPHAQEGLGEILRTYRETADFDVPWAETGRLERLMQIYAAYHGLAGLAWCYSRDELGGEFPSMNRELIHRSSAALA